MNRKRIAVIGAGVAGLSAAWTLARRHDVTLLEKQPRVGGHANTLSVADPRGELAIDTGFVVFNDRNYPCLLRLFEHLNVPSRATDMSFALSLNEGELEWAGDNLNTLFAQRRNLFSPRFLGMVREILRFNSEAKRELSSPVLTDITLGDYLDRGAYSAGFRDNYLLPMAAAIWSCPPATMSQFPAASFLRFFYNHGLLDLVNRPQWRTVEGGSREYVQRLLASYSGRLETGVTLLGVVPGEHGVTVFQSGKSPEFFDELVFACHADEAHQLLDNRAHAARAALGRIVYQPNHTYLHRDPRLMPRLRRVWSSWNYLAYTRAQAETRISVTYWMNRLQGLQAEHDYMVSLNPPSAPRDELIIADMLYHHPIFDYGALSAQHNINELQGLDHLWFCGSYLGYGFHEDALRSALGVAGRLGAQPPWVNDPTVQPVAQTAGVLSL